MSDDRTESMLLASVRQHAGCAYMIIFGLVAAVVACSALVSVSGAVIAPGTFVVESSGKKIQHLDGGVVRLILVSNGDMVHTGQALVELDDALIRATIRATNIAYYERRAEQKRLSSELAGASMAGAAFPRAEIDGDQALAIQKQHRRLMLANWRVRAKQLEQVGAQIHQANIQISGLRRQITMYVREQALVDEQAARLQALQNQQLVATDRVVAARRDAVKIRARRIVAEAEIERLYALIAERRIQEVRIEVEAAAATLERLQAVRAEVAQLEVDLVKQRDLLSRVTIRAPAAGVVHNLAIHTLGGVVQPADVIMEIIPRAEALMMEVFVRPVDIDQVHRAQIVTIQLPGLNLRTAPTLQARVETVSPDLVEDATSNQSFYIARVRLLDGELRRLGGQQLVPGMPGTAFIQTRSRSILSYFADPVWQQIARALKED